MGMYEVSVETVIKEAKLGLVKGESYAEWDNGEMNVWNYKLEVFDGIIVTIIVWQDEFLEEGKELYTRSNSFIMKKDDFMKTPWRELEKRINEACYYAQ